MPYRWPVDTEFTRIELAVKEQWCRTCGGALTICDHRHHRVFTLTGPLHLVCKLAHCPTRACPAHSQTLSPAAETAIAMPWWVLGWDVVCWLGQRHFARHWSVGQLRTELADTYQIRLSADAIETYIHYNQQMLAARRQAPGQLAAAYADVEAVMLAIDGLQPGKGHETLYVVRELERKRVWFAEPLLSSATTEVQQLLVQARVWAERLGKRVRLWMSDKQDAFVRGVAAEFPGVPHRYYANHFLRDVAKPVLEADSHAKVKMRRTVRGLRAIEREVLAAQHAPDAPPFPAVQAEEGRCPQVQAEEGAWDVVLDYCAAVRGILNDDQGGPLHPPGPPHGRGLGGGADLAPSQSGGEKRGTADDRLTRLARYIDRGLSAVHAAQEAIRAYVEDVRAIQATLEADRGPCAQRQAQFQVLQAQLQQSSDPIR